MLKVTCDQAIVVANVIGVSCFVVFMLICLVVVKKRFVSLNKCANPEGQCQANHGWQGTRAKLNNTRRLSTIIQIIIISVRL